MKLSVNHVGAGIILMIGSRIQVARLALGSCRLSKFGMESPFFGSFRNGHFWEVRRIEISMQEPDIGPLSWFEPSFLGGRGGGRRGRRRRGLKTSKLECPKNLMNTQWIDQQFMLFETQFYKNSFLHNEKVHFVIMRLSSKIRASSFCAVFSTICGTVVKMKK